MTSFKYLMTPSQRTEPRTKLRTKLKRVQTKLKQVRNNALVGLDESQLQRAQGQDLFSDLLTQARDVQIFHIPEKMLDTCNSVR